MMRPQMRRSQENYCDANWVSHVKLVGQVVGDGQRDNIRYTVEHIEVFKKPVELDALSSEIFGSTLGDLALEEGKEYLLTGKYYDGKLCCTVYGQVRPDDMEAQVAEWSQIPASFIDEMKTFEA